MRKSTITEIKSMKLMKNKVMVKLLRKPDELILDNDIKLFLDYSFAHEQHAPTRGEVVNIFEGSINSRKMNWITEKEIKVGDIAVYSYEAAMDAWKTDDSKFFTDEEKNLYFLLDYEDFFAVKRGKTIIPVNGYVLCSPVHEEIRSKIIIPKHIGKRTSDRFGIVKYVGKPNKAYQLLPENGPELRKDLKDAIVQEGDIIVFDKYCDLPIEHELHLGMVNEIMYRMHSCNIKAVIDKKYLKRFGIQTASS